MTPDKTSPLPPVAHAGVSGRVAVDVQSVGDDCPVSFQKEDGLRLRRKTHCFENPVLRPGIAAKPPELSVVRRQNHRAFASAQYIHMLRQKIYAVCVQNERHAANFEAAASKEAAAPPTARRRSQIRPRPCRKAALRAPGLHPEKASPLHHRQAETRPRSRTRRRRSNRLPPARRDRQFRSPSAALPAPPASRRPQALWTRTAEELFRSLPCAPAANAPAAATLPARARALRRPNRLCHCPAPLFLQILYRKVEKQSIFKLRNSDFCAKILFEKS